MDAERAHEIGFGTIKMFTAVGLGAALRIFTRPDPSLRVSALGRTFSSPFGLAAGFDKDATGVIPLGNLGFGHIEVGTITAQPQPGNEKPRLFRLVQDRALINRMGFNNDGASFIVPRLERARMRRHRPVIGVNIGKTKVVAVDKVIGDYVQSAQILSPLADYLVVNVSSPNTPGLRTLQDAEKLEPLLVAVRDAAGSTPLLVKIAPDLSDDDVVSVAEMVLSLGLAGVIATNTTTSRSALLSPDRLIEAAGEGGLSGEPLKSRSLEILQLLRSRLPEHVCIISVGGVTTGDDVMARVKAGATLVQGYSGFVYEGPLWARRVNKRLKRLGFEELNEDKPRA